MQDSLRPGTRYLSHRQDFRHEPLQALPTPLLKSSGHGCHGSSSFQHGTASKGLRSERSITPAQTPGRQRSACAPPDCLAAGCATHRFREAKQQVTQHVAKDTLTCKSHLTGPHIHNTVVAVPGFPTLPRICTRQPARGAKVPGRTELRLSLGRQASQGSSWN